MKTIGNRTIFFMTFPPVYLVNGNDDPIPQSRKSNLTPVQNQERVPVKNKCIGLQHNAGNSEPWNGVMSKIPIIGKSPAYHYKVRYVRKWT